MKLNPSVIRGILLTAEEYCDYDHFWEYKKDTYESVFLAELTHDEIIYHIKQCEAAGLIENVHYYDGGNLVIVTDLTPTGHEFLANIRNDSIWKKVLAKGAGASLPVVMEVAKKAALSFYLS